jgi:hypothetical protein
VGFVMQLYVFTYPEFGFILSYEGTMLLGNKTLKHLDSVILD